MNIKTTFFLSIVLFVAILGLYLIRSKPVASALPSAEELRKGSTARDLLKDKLGETQKIVCSRPGKPEWVFEKVKSNDPAAASTWQMTAPSKLAVQLGEAERIARTVQGLQYEVSYKPGESGAISAADAGLDPPQLTVAMTDQEGKTATVDIGKAASEQSTYVRVAGSNEICVGNSNLRQLLKAKPVEYRDKQLWTFDVNSVKRLEVVEQGEGAAAVTYVFVPDGGKWVMQSPVAARASGKVAAAVQELARLRAIQWVDDTPEKLAVYGLAPSALTLRATVEKKVEPKKDETADKDHQDGSEEKVAEAVPTQIETVVHELQIAARSPIGEETKVYIRAGNESVVGTVMKTAADKLKPVMDEWRDMMVTQANAAAATKLELATKAGAITATSKNGEWAFDADGSRAETSSITTLLDTVKNLRAVAFVDNPSTDAATMGFDKPQAEIKLTIPGEEGLERITVGGPTDAATKHLVYVRRGESTSVAKVKAADVALLLQSPLAYRDRTLLDVDGGEVQKIGLSRLSKHTQGRVAVTLEKRDGDWAMTSPVSAPVRPDRVKKLTDALAKLRADGVLAESGEPSAFGLQDPLIEWTVGVQPPSTYRLESAKDEAGGSKEEAGGEGDKQPKPVTPIEVKPPPISTAIAITEHDGRIVAKRSDRPTIYQLGDALYADLSAELRTADVFSFDDKKVTSFSVRDGDQTHKFERKNNKWVYAAEADLPLDGKKVDDLLLRIRDLKTERYVAYGVGDAAAFGLAQPARDVTVQFDDGTSTTLRVSAKPSVTEADAGFYSVFQGRSDVFLLTQATIDRFKVSLEQLE